MTFQIFCKSCGSKLNAREDLIGQTRNCPKCSQPILIQREEAPTESAASAESTEPTTPIIVNAPTITDVPMGPKLGEIGGYIEGLPERLEYRNRYFVIGTDRIIALWEPGKGWQINVGNGFASAKKNPAAIPDQGTFAFVELVVEPPEEGDRLKELKIFKVSIRGALTALYRDDGEILHKVDSPCELTKSQKNALMNHLQRNFMFEILAEAKEIVAYLTQ